MSLGAARVRQLLYGVALLCSCAAAAETSAPDKVSREARREMLAGPMWFGPRLGKRAATQLSSGYDDPQIFAILESVLEAVDTAYDGHSSPVYYDMPTLTQALRASGQQYFSPRLGRETDPDDVRVNFVPRLGRQLIATNRAQYTKDRDSVEQRPPHFSPRLGRESADRFSPTLGWASAQ